MAVPRAEEKVGLVPWSPNDDAHYQRMYAQRVHCGWREDEIGLWRDLMLAGEMILYWVVVSESVKDREDLVAAHTRQFPTEAEPLTDTATVVGKEHRKPSGKSFTPVGHIALRYMPELNTQYSLPKDTIWLKSLYISWALQAGGLGRSAMAQAERLAAASPHSASVIALDTVTREYALSESHLRWLYDRRGRARPGSPRSNQDWYMSQGYEEIPATEGSFYPGVDENGAPQNIPVVYLSKKLSVAT